MKSKKNLVLLGMMGSGKSTIGFLVSKKLNLKFVDIDQVIEKEIGMKINEIFRTKKEKFFRNLEEKITIKSLNLDKKVISLGGGAFLNEKIQNIVLKNNISFWLNLDSATLLKRIRINNNRPIVTNSSDNQLIKLMSQREKIYSKANFTIKCDGLKKVEVVNKIVEIYEQN